MSITPLETFQQVVRKPKNPRVIPNVGVISEQIKDWPPAQKEVATLLTDGHSVKNVIAATGLPLNTVRGIANLIGWEPRWRLFASCSKKKVGSNGLTWAEIVRLYTVELKPLQEIADIAGGVTRERIRQVLFYNKVTGRDRFRRKREIRGETKKTERFLSRKIIQLNTELHYSQWRKLWAEGVPMKEMAEQLGIKKLSLQTTICKLRKTHPGWFPYRYDRYAKATEEPALAGVI